MLTGTASLSGRYVTTCNLVWVTPPGHFSNMHESGQSGRDPARPHRHAFFDTNLNSSEYLNPTLNSGFVRKASLRALAVCIERQGCRCSSWPLSLVAWHFDPQCARHRPARRRHQPRLLSPRQEAVQHYRWCLKVRPRQLRFRRKLRLACHWEPCLRRRARAPLRQPHPAQLLSPSRPQSQTQPMRQM